MHIAMCMGTITWGKILIGCVEICETQKITIIIIIIISISIQLILVKNWLLHIEGYGPQTIIFAQRPLPNSRVRPVGKGRRTNSLA